MEDIHYLLNRKDLEEAFADLKAHWDSLEEIKAKKRGIGTRYQGQSTLHEYVEEFGRRSVETRRCLANLVRLRAVENLPLHMGTYIGFVKSMRWWEPRWPNICKQSVTRFVEEKSHALWADFKREMPEIAARMDIAFTTDFWTSLTYKELHDNEHVLDNIGLASKNALLGTMHFLKKHTTANIFDRLLNAHIDVGVWPRMQNAEFPKVKRP